MSALFRRRTRTVPSLFLVALSLAFGAPAGPTGAAASAVWRPPVGTRWQWQLEGSPGKFLSTGGIDVGICTPPFGGVACIRPDVFDVDLYVDQSITGPGNFVIDTAAVNAIHASGRHAICYLSAGTIEKFRPDYPSFVAFNQACGGCLIGKPFSSTFPDEFWANINDEAGQSDFMLSMLKARTDRCAAAGFDGIEYDVVDAYAQGKAVTGWTIGSQTQLAYNKALAAMAHADGLSVALKNDGGQIAALLPFFDYAINEQCFQYRECTGGSTDIPAPGWSAFVNAGKAVFEAEYRTLPPLFCLQARMLGFSAIKKAFDYSLDGKPWTPCR